ncbi:short transient receptor potential channel 2-like protein [Labeo rohita]|uniref:Short transient receptor potential channel 2-like protein n=1 Tax=Labeo rohita TaxID=84645 RepID=A0A498LKQ7_LABRO|nr:short transient receptor potential channel 2-like protein [Labeo rohita]
MAPIKIKHIVSFTSQDSKNGVNNLCDGSNSSRPWLCSVQERSGVLRAELQMERVSAIGFIDVGNCGSAFIQIDVGRSSWSLDHPYITLLPTATLMSPTDSKEGTGRQNVRMFKKADFLPQAAEESWDRLRVTCTQPFNKRSQFGLSFLRIRTVEDEAEDSSVQNEDIAAEQLHTPEKMTSVLEWLSSPAIQNTFFGRITGDVSSNAQGNPGSLSRAERMVKAAHSNRRSLSTSPSSSTSSTTPQREDNVKTPPGKLLFATTQTEWGNNAFNNPKLFLSLRAILGGFRTSSDQKKTPQEQRKTSKARYEVRKKESFSPDYLPFHASTCLDSDSVDLMGLREETEVMSSPHSSVFGSGTDEHMVPCPLCSFRFPPDRIQQHASTCGDTPEQWREIVNKKFRFPPELLGAIREGNVNMVSSLLKTGDGIIRQLDDSEDRLWREALNLSIRLGNEDTMDNLLQGVKFDFRQIHEALLVAVDTNQPRVVKRLLDRLDLEKGNKMDVRSFSMAIFDHSIDDSQFAPGVTPLTLACQKDLYDIVTMLNQKGHEIPWPHKISCVCLECRNGRQYDLLKFSLSRINTYRGIASRAYLSITAEDAMLSAFRLSRDLRKLSKKEPEFKPQYLALEQLCQEFAVELLGMCRNQSEVTTILNSLGDKDEDSEDELDQQAFEEGIPNLARLRLAVNYNQKQLGKTLRIPVIKFLLHSASYMWFLITLLGESIAMEVYRDSFASREQTILHNSFHMVWVVGFFWFECKEIWIEGLKSYFLDWWNCLDVMVLSMYLASFALRVVIMLKVHFLCQLPDKEEECVYFTETMRNEWHQEDPQFIAEVLFAVTSMLSFTRLAYILPAHESLGTLQISIGKMIDDMMRFMFILVIIGTAFLCGVNNIYVPYMISPNLGRLNETFSFLFWTMFGMADQTYVDMPEFVLAEFVGRILYGIYTLVIVIVLLNMLIAMITNSFQKIEDDADVEWKFARSKLYLSYFREGLTMPVPFNIIPSPKAKDDMGAGENRIPYRQQVIRALVQRYIESARREFEETKRKDVGNRITELSKVIGQLHTEMKHIQMNLFDHSDNPKGNPSGGSSFLGKYILGAKNNFRGFNSNERSTVPLHEPILHEEPAEKTVEENDEETADVQESPPADTEPDRKSNEEQSSEGEIDNAVEDMNETEGGEEEGDVETGNDDVTEISMDEEKEEEAEKNTDAENTSETVIDIESNTDAESEASGNRENEMIAEEVNDNTDEATGETDQNEAETEENGEVEESSGTTEDINEDIVDIISENTGEGIKIDLNKANLVSFLAKRIEEKLERNFSFIANQASSPTGSDDSQDTGFGSQEFDLSTSGP